MRLKNILWMSCSLLIAGCHFSNAKPENVQFNELKLGNIHNCKKYSGLPENWLKDKHAGMVWIPSGSFNLGSDLAYPDEINFGKKQRSVQGFWIDQTEVTIAQFQKFVEATHYITDAEKQNEAAVFSPDIKNPQQW